MTLIIETGDPSTPQATALLQASHGLMQSLFPAEDNHYLSIDALKAPHIHFFIARENDILLGCAALADKTDYGEIKSMFVDPNARGKGVADALMRQLIDHAGALGLPKVMLETGDKLASAHRLYARHGFLNRGPFGDYDENPSSLFMENTFPT